MNDPGIIPLSPGQPVAGSGAGPAVGPQGAGAGGEPSCRTLRPGAGQLSLIRLLTWLSPAFPIGAFAYSHGLETAIAAGCVTDRAGLVAWLETLLLAGSGWNDLVLCREAHVSAGCDAQRFADAVELAAALSGSFERRAETLALGDAFLAAAGPWRATPPVRQAIAYPVAFGMVCTEGGVALGDTLAAYAHGFAANLVFVATRLVPLGQREAMAAMHALEPTILAAAERAATSTLDDLGSCALLSEIAAMRHETLSPRLFRS